MRSILLSMLAALTAASPAPVFEDHEAKADTPVVCAAIRLAVSLQGGLVAMNRLASRGSDLHMAVTQEADLFACDIGDRCEPTERCDGLLFIVPPCPR